MALSPTEESMVRQLIAQNPALLNLASSESTIISKLGATKVSLSDLSAATSLSDADLALVRQGLNDKSFAMSVLLDYVGNNLTLPAASETVAGLIGIATTAEAQALVNDTDAMTPAKLAAAFGGSNQGLTTNGYQKLPSGLIIQWGQTGVISNGQTGTISFPVSFVTGAFAITASGIALSNSTQTSGSPNLLSASQFNMRNTTSISLDYFYIAIGY